MAGFGTWSAKAIPKSHTFAQAASPDSLLKRRKEQGGFFLSSMSHTKFIMLWLYLCFIVTAQPTLSVFILKILCKVRQSLFYRPVSFGEPVAEQVAELCFSGQYFRTILPYMWEWSSLCHKLLAWKKRRNNVQHQALTFLFPFRATWKSRRKK